MVELLKLYRSPLKEGESVYAMGGIAQGDFVDGPRKGEKKPDLQSLLPTVLEDGRLLWEIYDCEANRKLCESFRPVVANPPYTYSWEFPGDKKAEPAAKPAAKEVEAPAPAAPIAKAVEVPTPKPAPKVVVAPAPAPKAPVKGKGSKSK